jgi:hypothetical protein
MEECFGAHYFIDKLVPFLRPDDRKRLCCSAPSPNKAVEYVSAWPLNKAEAADSFDTMWQVGVRVAGTPVAVSLAPVRILYCIIHLNIIVVSCEYYMQSGFGAMRLPAQAPRGRPSCACPLVLLQEFGLTYLHLPAARQAKLRWETELQTCRGAARSASEEEEQLADLRRQNAQAQSANVQVGGAGSGRVGWGRAGWVGKGGEGKGRAG